MYTSAPSHTGEPTHIPSAGASPVWDQQYEANQLPQDFTPAFSRWKDFASYPTTETASGGELHVADSTGANTNVYYRLSTDTEAQDTIFSGDADWVAEFKVKVPVATYSGALGATKFKISFWNYTSEIAINIFDNRIVWGNDSGYKNVIMNATAYHTYKIYYDVSATTAHLYVDGTEQDSMTIQHLGTYQAVLMNFQAINGYGALDATLDYIYCGLMETTTGEPTHISTPTHA